MHVSSCSGGSVPSGFRSPHPEAYILYKTNLTFIDPNIECPSLLIQAARSDADLVFLSRHRDGLKQIVGHLRGRGRLSSIHLLAEVVRGQLLLCGKALGLREMRERALDLSRIGRSVASSGQIIVGAGENPDGQGDRLLRTLAEFASVAVACWSGGGRLAS